MTELSERLQNYQHSRAEGADLVCISSHYISFILLNISNSPIGFPLYILIIVSPFCVCLSMDSNEVCVCVCVSACVCVFIYVCVCVCVCVEICVQHLWLVWFVRIRASASMFVFVLLCTNIHALGHSKG